MRSFRGLRHVSALLEPQNTSVAVLRYPWQRLKPAGQLCNRRALIQRTCQTAEAATLRSVTLPNQSQVCEVVHSISS
jgi:hypothetical protein